MAHLDAIRAELAAAGAVTALVGSKIYPQVAPQGAVAPFVVLTTVSSVPENSFDGLAQDRLRFGRLQVDVYAKGYGEAHQIADAVDFVISNLSRPDLSAAQESSQDLYDDETQLRRVSTDYLVAL